MNETILRCPDCSNQLKTICTHCDGAEPAKINTNVRLFDLVRYQRADLHEEGLITDEEYAWLCAGAPMSKSPNGGSPSRQRLEDYDELKAAAQATADSARSLVDAANAERDAVRADLADTRRRLAEVEKELSEEKADYESLTQLLNNRFPKRENGSLPDYAVEDVLVENAALRNAADGLACAVGSAPHDKSCYWWPKHPRGEPGACTCWKHKALADYSALISEGKKPTL